jgi:phage shock protein C
MATLIATFGLDPLFVEEDRMTTQSSGTTKPKLRRTTQERMLFGVCGGLAAYFGVDPVLVRLAFVLTTLAGGAGVVAYLILAIVVPCEDAAEGQAAALAGRLRSGGQQTQLGALLLIALGAFLLLGNIGVLTWLRGDLVWPILIMALGAAILLVRRPDR